MLETGRRGFLKSFMLPVLLAPIALSPVAKLFVAERKPLVIRAPLDLTLAVVGEDHEGELIMLRRGVRGDVSQAFLRAGHEEAEFIELGRADGDGFAMALSPLRKVFDITAYGGQDTRISRIVVERPGGGIVIDSVIPFRSSIWRWCAAPGAEIIAL